MSNATSAPPGRPRRRLLAAPRFSTDPEVRAVQVGVIATLLFHFLVFFLFAMLLKPDIIAFRPRAKRNPDPFSIELAPEPTPAKKQPSKFVETNPDAPENIPDKTDNFGAQNQQAAQEKPLPDQHHDRPSIEGQKDLHSTQIVDGRLSKPSLPRESAPPAPVTPPTESTATPKREQNPLSGFEKIQGENPQSFGSNVAKVAPNPEDVPEKVEGMKDAPQVEGATATALHIDPKKPMPRPQIVRNVRPAVFEENKFGTSNMGITAYDARWSSYGQYLQKLIEVVQVRWDDLITESKNYPQQGTQVTVTFVLESTGKISAIRKVDGPSNAQQATGWCVTAISPNEGFTYGPWTDDMVAVLGTSQELTFTFLYR